MTEESFVPFDEYKKQHFKPRHETNKTDDEIINNAENILRMMSRPK